MMKYTGTGNKKLSAMTVGTVQFGMNYGIANTEGKLSDEQSFAMLRTAFKNGITSLDTARGYGTAEEVIGRFLKNHTGALPYITTKFLRHENDEKGLEKHVIHSVEESLERLGVPKVDAILLHNVGDMFEYGNKIAKITEKLIQRGYTDQIGVSIYTQTDLEEMLKYPQYTVTQLPMSIFDQRLIASGATEKLKERGYTVFVRSVFLQGLFFLNPDKIEDPILAKHAVPNLYRLGEIAKSAGMTIAELAIAFIRDTAGVTSLVLGADTAEQVRENISYFETPELSKKMLAQLQNEFKEVNIPEIMKVLSRPKPQN